MKNTQNKINRIEPNGVLGKKVDVFKYFLFLNCVLFIYELMQKSLHQFNKLGCPDKVLVITCDAGI